MLIKSGTELIESLLLQIVILIAIIGIGFFEFKVGIGPILICCSMFLFCFVRHAASIGRTIIMDENRCIVKFLWYEKEYRWDELKVKRIEDYRNNWEHRWKDFDDIKGAVFAPHKIYKEGRWTAYTYSSYVHPLSVFYVYLIPKKELEREVKKSGNNKNYLSYVVEAEVFWRKMQEWNIEIEDSTNKKYAYNCRS